LKYGLKKKENAILGFTAGTTEKPQQLLGTMANETV
jgi:hypothetical protein